MRHKRESLLDAAAAKATTMDTAVAMAAVVPLRSVRVLLESGMSSPHAAQARATCGRGCGHGHNHGHGMAMAAVVKGVWRGQHLRPGQGCGHYHLLVLSESIRTWH